MKELVPTSNPNLLLSVHGAGVEYPLDVFQAPPFTLDYFASEPTQGQYAALHDFAKVFGYPAGAAVAGTELPQIDFVALATGQGCVAVRVERADALRDALRDALCSPRPTVVEVEIA